jgi:hypothetical protein
VARRRLTVRERLPLDEPTGPSPEGRAARRGRSRTTLGLRVCATALPAARGATTGFVRLTLLPDQLVLELSRASVHLPGFATPSLASQSLRVPYAAVRSVVREGERLWLTLDPRAAAPHTSFCLTDFTDRMPARIPLLPSRALVRFAWAVGGLVAAALVVPRVPHSLAAGLVGRGVVALAVAAMGAAALGTLVRRLVAARSETLGRALEEELGVRLGLAQAPVRPAWLQSAGRAPAALELHRPIAVALGLAATTTLTWWGVQRASQVSLPRPSYVEATTSPLAILTPELASAAARHARRALPPPPDRVSVGEPCACPGSLPRPFGAEGLPVASVLLAASPDDASGVVSPGSPRGGYRFDVVVVNNSATPLWDVKATVTFARRNRAGQRVGMSDRGLFYAGPLGPGELRKWTVRGPGTEVTIASSARGLGAGLDTPLSRAGLAHAAPDAFEKLSSSRFAVARAHAARALAQLGDERALQAVERIAVRPPPPIAQELHAATATPRTCQFEVRAHTARACVSNPAATGTYPAVGDGARVWVLPSPIGPRAGRRVEVVTNSGEAPTRMVLLPSGDTSSP